MGFKALAQYIALLKSTKIINPQLFTDGTDPIFNNWKF